MNRILMSIVLAACTGLVSSTAQAQQSPATQPAAVARAAPAQTQPTDGQADLDRKFAETMSGATLVGHFTTHGNDQKPHEDRYTIVSAKKLAGDLWVITAKIQYRGAAVPIPLVVPVKWAGDTPVISVTDMTIPGMGSYTARVMIFKDQYSGMWDAGDHGGLMSGKIEHTPPTTAPATAPSVGVDQDHK